MLWRALHAADGRSAAEIRDAVARVFSGGAFDHSATHTLGGMLMDFIARILARIFEAVAASPPLGNALLWSGYAVIAVVLARFVYAVTQRSKLTAHRSPGGARGADTVANPWLAAQQAAARGNYTEAAHFLYAALLVAIASRERVRLHPSKTAGDYVRELRRRSSPVFAPFRSFVRAFEFIIYGRGTCDRAQFEQLRAIAAPLVGTGE